MNPDDERAVLGPVFRDPVAWLGEIVGAAIGKPVPVPEACIETCDTCDGEGSVPAFDGPVWMLTSAEQAQRIDCPNPECIDGRVWHT